MSFKKDFRVIFATLLVTGLAAQFWAGSRYPDLDEKAAMAGNIPISDTLSFERVLEYEATDPYYKRVSYGTVNWISTNRKGMTFGVLFGAAFLTLLGYMRRKGTGSRVLDAVVGMFTGAPLGVCVNCVAPIAKSMHKAGASFEIVMGTMFSSPTLNVIVLTMLFSLFPAYLIALKIGMTLLVILVMVPLFGKYLDKGNNNSDVSDPEACELPVDGPTGLVASLKSFVADFTGRLFWVAKTTVPLMFLAGLLGVTLAEFVDLQSFFGDEVTWWGMLSAALLGAFLPAPIALDLILAQALYVAGVPIAYVMIFLFTLGIYSVYSGMIVWNTISSRVAMACYGAVTVLGIVAGIAAQQYHEFENDDAMDFFEKEFEDLSSNLNTEAEAAVSKKDLIPKISKTMESWQGVTIARQSLNKRSKSGKPFTKLSGTSLGLYRPIKFSSKRFFPPFFNGRSLAAGDIDGDGYDDIAVSTQDGIRIFRNNKGQSFSLRKIEGGKLEDAFVAAFVDMDNDGWLDLYVTTYGKGHNYLLLNNGRGYFKAEPILMPSAGARLTKSAAFGDLSGNGYLDIVEGNWFMGFPTQTPPKESLNAVIYNSALKFKRSGLSNIAGETLTTLVTDFNMDNRVDLVVGNDFSRPDMFYRGTAKGLVPIRKGGSIPVATRTTMSIDTADINNDLKLDMYSAQITGSFEKGSNLEEEAFSTSYCDGIDVADDRKACKTNIKIKKIVQYSKVSLKAVKQCKAIQPASAARECMVQVMMRMAIKDKKPEYCKKIPKEYRLNRDICTARFAAKPWNNKDEDKFVPQIEKKNVLLIQGNKNFTDQAQKWGATYTGWSWNAKFADLDNDRYQDMYVANGYWLNTKIHSNVFFHNQAGKKFERREKEFGLVDERVVGAYVYVDYDLDGDLDIISEPVNGLITVYRNDNRSNRAIQFNLRDSRANSHCIGCKIYITSRSGSQIREIKSGGGFHSFDPAVAHFGMGKDTHVNEIKVVWSDGSTWTKKGKFDAGHRYTLVRSN